MLSPRHAVRRLAPVLLLAACAGGDGDPGAAGGTAAPAAEAAAAGTAARPASTVERGPRLARRVLIVAVDGATWDVADPLLAAGELPHLAALVGRGVRAELATLEPTLSPAIWTTIATGVEPDRHGILGFDGVPGKTMQTLPNARMRRVKAFWDILPDFGLTTGTVGWWVTWPCDDLGPGSYTVSDRVPYTRMEAAIGRDDPTDADACPPGLLEEVLPLVRRPEEIDPAVVARFLKLDRRGMERLVLAADYKMGSFLPEFKYVYQSDRSSFDIARWLFAERPVDVASVYFTGIDTVSHLFWHFTYPEGFEEYDTPAVAARSFRDTLPLYYRQVDSYLGELTAAAGGEATVLVVSDHGFGPTGYLPWSGGHDRITPGAPVAPPGMLVAAGPGIARGRMLERAHVLDLMPTLLHLLGLPAARDMPGRVLTEALEPGSPPPLPRIASYETVGTPRETGPIPVDEAGDAERRKRLKALGYLE